MGRRTDDSDRVEFGDFQTPPALATQVCRVLGTAGLVPGSIVEPTCGVGNLLLAAMDTFPFARRVLGMDVNRTHVASARRRLRGLDRADRASVEVANFFEVDWPARIASLPEPVLFIGNPPWVTSSDLGHLKSANHPKKANFQRHAGMDALTGKSNFDISEWMIVKLLSWLDGRRGDVAMLCKRAVARKALSFAWQHELPIERAAMYRIDASLHFGADVEACLLVCRLGLHGRKLSCAVFEGLHERHSTGMLGWRDGMLVADSTLYDRHKALVGVCHPTWRSGVKHDCASVMELRRTNDGYANAAGERVALESRFVYPMLKGSDVARDGACTASRWMIVPQRHVGEDTSGLEKSAPLIWAYLTRHRRRLHRRASSIYRGKPPFSIFGVGDYTFARWKVAIAGLYKKLEFRLLGPTMGKPVVLDDTCYFIACRSRRHAELVHRLVSSAVAKEFYSAFVFWDAKRPITTTLLRKLDLERLAGELGLAEEYMRWARSEALGATSPRGSPARDDVATREVGST